MAEAEPGTSKIENEIFTLLKVAFGGGVADYRIGAKRADMAFHLSSVPFRGKQEDLVLVVEYDGAYWHAGREESDLRKAEWISDSGEQRHEVIRIREAPLSALRGQDVEVPKGADAQLCARLTLLHVTHLFLDWFPFDATRNRIEHFLVAADAQLDYDQVGCVKCRQLAELLSDAAANCYLPSAIGPYLTSVSKSRSKR